MPDLPLKMLITRSLLTEPLIKGEIRLSGIDLEIEVAKDVDAASRSLFNPKFDIAEIDIATYVRARKDEIPIIALPLFSSGRRFLHRGMLWSTRSGIRDLHDLPSRVAVTPQFWLASSVWQRKLLGMNYQVEPDGLSWVTLQPERMPAMNVPYAILHRLETAGRSAEELARSGSADIVLLPEAVGPVFTQKRTIGAPPPFVPSFPAAAAAGNEFFEKTGNFPILNVTVIREPLVTEEPWLVESICEGYVAAKKLAQSREQLSNAPQPGPGETTTWMKELMGDDPWAYGLSANAKPLNAFLAAVRTQRLVFHRFELAELFASNLPADLQ